MKSKRLYLLVLMISTFAVSAQNTSYYFSKELDYSYKMAVEKVKEALKEQSFGVITEIDMHITLAEKLEDINIKPYKIIGACNPGYAYKTLQKEENIGLFLPCKVLVKEIDENKSEVVMINTTEMMKIFGNDELLLIADEITIKFKKALESL